MRDRLAIQFRPGPLLGPLWSRQRPGRSLNEIAKRDLLRYYTILIRTLCQIKLTEAEWNLLREALELHHVDRAMVVPRVLEIIAKGTSRR